MSLLLAACAAVLIVLAVLAYYDRVPWSLAIGWLLVEAAVARATRRLTEVVARRVGRPAGDLAIMAELLARIEGEPVEAARLQSVRASLEAGGGARLVGDPPTDADCLAA